MIDVSSFIGSLPKRSDRLSVNGILSLAKKHGIKYLILSHTSAHLSKSTFYGNRLLQSIIKKYTQLYMAYVFNPLAPEEEYVGEKVKLVRVSPLYHGYSLTEDKLVRRIRDFAEKLSVPIHIPLRLHFSEPYQVKVTAVRDFVFKCEDISVIVGGFNYDIFLEVLRYLGKFDNVYFEISLLQSYRAVETLVKEVSADRVLFGTNMPFSYPLASILKVSKADLSEKEKKLIFEENTKKLLKFE